MLLEPRGGGADDDAHEIGLGSRDEARGLVREERIGGRQGERGGRHRGGEARMAGGTVKEAEALGKGKREREAEVGQCGRGGGWEERHFGGAKLDSGVHTPSLSSIVPS